MKRNLFAAVAVSMILASPTHAANIIDEWASVKAPKAPELKAVTVDPKTTALLMLDFMNQNCGQRPRCLETIPAMKKLLAEARAHKVPVVYSIIANSTPADVIKDVAPLAEEPHVLSGPDKFRNTDLEKILKDKGITTVIAVGTASNGAVLYTGQRCGVSWHECDHSWSMGCRQSILTPSIHGLYIHECAVGVREDHAYPQRHD